MASTRRKPGQLGPQVEGYRAWLADRGYTPQTVRNMLADLGQLGVWMSREGLVPAELDEDGDCGICRGPARGWPEGSRSACHGSAAELPEGSRRDPGSGAAAGSFGAAAR